MEFYLTIFIFYLIIGFWDLNRQDVTPWGWKMFIFMSPLFLLAALRSESVGNDTIVYKYAYEAISYYNSYTEALVNSRMEAGYVLLSFVSNIIGLSYYGFQIVITLFMYISWSIFIKRYSKRPGISLFLFSILILGVTMNVVRMYLAISILLFSIPCIEKRKPFLFFLILVLAFFFHHSSIIFLIIYPLCTIRYNRTITILIFIVSVIIAYLGASFFEVATSSLGMYESYVDGRYFDEDRSKLGVYIDIAIQTVIIIYLYKQGVLSPDQYKQDDFLYKTEEIKINYFCIMCILINYALTIIGLSNNAMNRLTGYYSYSVLLALPLAFESHSSIDKRNIMYLIVSFCYLIRWVVIMTYRPMWNQIIPYETFF